MPRNRLSDLNNHLFEELERLNDDDLTDEELEKEIERSKAIAHVAQTIINNASLSLSAIKYRDVAIADNDIPDMLKIENRKETNKDD